MITIKAEKNPKYGLSNNDYVQIVKGGQLAKPSDYHKWKQAKAGAAMAAMNSAQMGGGYPPNPPNPPYPMMYGGAPQPSINIKVVAGSDHSVSTDGGEQPHQNTPLISNSDGEVSTQEQNSGGGQQKEEKTIMSGLADFSKLVINKLV